MSESIRIRQILFASDFSPHASHAFDAALALAQHFGARLHLLHVVHHSHEEQAAWTRLEAFARERAKAAESVVVVATGQAAAQIVSHARREKVDLIVMGTHGRTGLAHVVRGSVAEAVMRRAPCLVLTIRRKAELPLAAEEAAGAEAGAQPHAALPGHCLVCAQPSPELVCEPCKARIRAEAFFHLHEEEKAGHR
jgi:nucleotide-binding universal stress UspA family protein